VFKLGREFGWLWAAFGISTFGTWLAFDAFPLIAILVLHSGPAAVAFGWLSFAQLLVVSVIAAAADRAWHAARGHADRLLT
jgi:hypothetical protein